MIHIQTFLTDPQRTDDVYPLTKFLNVFITFFNHQFVSNQEIHVCCINVSWNVSHSILGVCHILFSRYVWKLFATITNSQSRPASWFYNVYINTIQYNSRLSRINATVSQDHRLNVFSYIVNFYLILLSSLTSRGGKTTVQFIQVCFAEWACYFYNAQKDIIWYLSINEIQYSRYICILNVTFWNRVTHIWRYINYTMYLYQGCFTCTAWDKSS